MSHVTLDDYDPFDPRVIADPYPYYALLRERAPVHRVEKHGFFVLTRHADVEAALLDPGAFSSAWGPGPAKVVQPIRTILNSDPPDHEVVRSIIARAFTPAAVRQLEPAIVERCDALVDDMVERGRGDLLADLAVPLPVEVIAGMLGVPAEDRASFKSWSDDIVGEIGGRRDARAARRAFSDYFRQVLEERKRQPREDLVSRLLEPAPGGERLSDPEVLAFCQALLVAGNETTTGLLANLFRALAERPDAWRHLREDPALVDSAVEESLRFDAPNQGLFRHTTRDVEVAGHTIPADTKVLVSFGSAGRDPDRHPDPELFDPARQPNRHLSFGAGIHTCLGASLGRLEARVALRTALSRIRELRLTERDLDYVPVFFIRCPVRLPLEYAA